MPLPGAASNPVSFARVLQTELIQIETRRAVTRDGLLTPESMPSDIVCPDDVPDEHVLRQRAFDQNLVGLALSGGGIRSATFALGFLQGLADLRLLKWIDYLSTVSGGGYIGSWFAAWVHRDGSVENVETLLHPNRAAQAKAERIGPGTARTLDDEPEPLHHLRSYSNYLTPKLGLFSSDTWVLGSIYIRNLLLNLLVVVSVAVALLVMLRGMTVAFAAALGPPLLLQGGLAAKQSCEIGFIVLALLAVVVNLAACGWKWRGLIGAALVTVATGAYFLALFDVWNWLGWIPGPIGTPEARLAGFGAVAGGVLFLTLLRIDRTLTTIAGRSREEPPDSSDTSPQSKRRFRNDLSKLHWGHLVPLLLFAVMVSWLALQRADPLERFSTRTAFVSGGIVCTLQLLVNWRTLGGFAVRRRRRTTFWLLAASLLGGFVGGAGLYWLVHGLHVWGQPARMSDHLAAAGPHVVVTIGPPLVLLVIAFSSMLLVGVASEVYSEALREWWASLSGWVFIYAVMWLVTFAVTLYGPAPILSREVRNEFDWAKVSAAVGWIAATLGGIFAGRSGETGRGRPNKVLNLIAFIAPHVFLVGLLVLLSATLHLVLRNWSGACRGYWNEVHTASWSALLVVLGVAAAIAGLMGKRIDVNHFSLHGLYANRLIRCYLGASRPKEKAATVRSPAYHQPWVSIRWPDTITGFDPLDDFPLSRLQLRRQRPDAENPHAQWYSGPCLILTTAMNLTQGDELAWQERQAESFALTPAYCGSRSTRYRPTEQFGGGLTLGTAVTISGAAVSPNMGYHSSPAVTAFLTVFNLRLGAWLGNPRAAKWRAARPESGFYHLFSEMFSRTNARSKYVYLSDGGHFDNLGVYELIRRRCRFIIVCDAGADPDFNLQDLGSLIRKVRTDFGVRIEVATSPLQPEGPDRHSKWHVTVGKIRYDDVDQTQATDGDDREHPIEFGANEGMLVYVKPTLTGDEPSDIVNYRRTHPEFPHETTADQFFSESQFESYRALGFHTARRVFCEAEGLHAGGDYRDFAERLFASIYDRWYPPPPESTQRLLRFNESYMSLQDKLRSDKRLAHLSQELCPKLPDEDIKRAAAHERSPDERIAERHMVAEMIALLENVWYGLEFDQYREHPVHEGWMEVFCRWFASPTFRKNWDLLKLEFTKEFRQYVDRDLGRTCRRRAEAGARRP